MSFTILDLEVQNHKHLGSIASPFCKDNYVVATAWARDGGDIQSYYFNNQAEANASNWAAEALEGAKVLVAHNATFEIHWLLHRHYDAFIGFLKRGGRIFCTQYAEYLLSHQTETYPNLNDTAQRYGGSPKIDEVKMLWEQGILTADIDKDLLMRYLAGEGGDICNTRKVCFGQYARLVEQEMLEMFWLRMDGLLYNAFCTFNGLYIDMDVANKQLAEGKARIAELEAEIMQLVPELPEYFEFNANSDNHLSALLFGGEVAYNTKVSYNPIKFEKVDGYMTLDGTFIPCEGNEKRVPSVHENNIIRYQRGKNAGEPKLFTQDSATEKLKWGEATFKFKGLIDLKSLPFHVQEMYLGKNAEYVGKRTLACGTPVYSTGKDSLELLANFTDIAKPLRELSSLNKDIGTYYLTHELAKDGTIKKTKGMLQFVGTDGIIHHNLNGTSTITGRLSSSNPNLQNLPRDGTSKVKAMFTSRFGGYVVEVDYTALEVVMLAAASGDKNLRAKLAAGTDMHCLRLSTKLKEDYDEICKILADKTHSRNKEIKEARTRIKQPSFAFQYGASAIGMSFATGCSVEEAEEFIRIETALFPQSVAYRTTVRDQVEESGSKAESLHREMNDAGQWSIYRRGFFRAKGGTCYSFRQYSQWKDRKQVMDYKDTQLANYWAQGEASLIVQVSSGLAIRWLLKNDFFGGKVLPINTVHDANYLDCADEELARSCGKKLAEIMAYAPKHMAKVIPAYKDWDYHTINFPAVPEFGSSMMDKEHC